MSIEFEADNVIAPIANTRGVRAVLVLGTNVQTQTFDLEQWFGELGNGGYFTFAADGGDVYLAFGGAAETIEPAHAFIASGAAGLIASGAASPTGGGSGMAYFIPNGQERNWRLIGGEHKTTGVGTAIRLHSFVSYRQSSGASNPTGYLRVHRSSLPEGAGVEAFPVPWRGPRVPTGTYY